ncbi:trypsin-like peptidase domain-containing protein [Spongiivirga sp. MCCC 1A20706]|uniref:S1C family serine protease n=1 Tax=Spongiivirga sp. MCCC 1A20706 TaxID=3160963 RepID=UPI003977BEA2
MTSFKRIFESLLFANLFVGMSFGQSISELYKKLNESVVQIKTIQSEIVNQGTWQNVMPVENIGTGFVVSKKGEIVTAAHLVQVAEDILVAFKDGTEIPAKVKYSHPIADVALISLLTTQNKKLYPLKFGDSDNTNIGDKIFVIGAPFGLEHSLSVGYIGGKYKQKDLQSGFITTDFIQTDAAINEGSSGAPLFNMSGEVVGIASFILTRSKGFQGISFAASSNIALNLLSDEFGIWTGIQSYLVDGHLAELLNIPQKGGVLVQKVATSSMGDFMGLRGGCCNMNIAGEELIVGGDIILAIENISLTNEESLLKAWKKIQTIQTGEFISLKVLRKGKTISIRKKLPDK